jgi:hypothetical protein
MAVGQTIVVAMLAFVGPSSIAHSQLPPPRVWAQVAGGGAVSSGVAHYAQSYQRFGLLTVGARVRRALAVHLDGVVTGHAQNFVCVLSDSAGSCYRPLDVSGVSASLVLAPRSTFPRSRWAVLAGLGGYRLPVGGDRFRERLGPSTVLGVHLSVETQWSIGRSLGLGVAFRPLLLPNVYGERLMLWPLAGGLRIWR